MDHLKDQKAPSPQSVDEGIVEISDKELEKAAGGSTYSLPGIVPDQNLPV